MQAVGCGTRRDTAPSRVGCRASGCQVERLVRRPQQPVSVRYGRLQALGGSGEPAKRVHHCRKRLAVAGRQRACACGGGTTLRADVR